MFRPRFELGTGYESEILRLERGLKDKECVCGARIVRSVCGARTAHVAICAQTEGS